VKSSSEEFEVGVGISEGFEDAAAGGVGKIAAVCMRCGT